MSTYVHLFKLTASITWSSSRTWSCDGIRKRETSATWPCLFPRSQLPPPLLPFHHSKDLSWEQRKLRKVRIVESIHSQDREVSCGLRRRTFTDEAEVFDTNVRRQKTKSEQQKIFWRAQKRKRNKKSVRKREEERKRVKKASAKERKKDKES